MARVAKKLLVIFICLVLPALSGRAQQQNSRPVTRWPTLDDPASDNNSSDARPPANPSFNLGNVESPAAKLQPFSLADTLAQVGDQYILKGELVGDANLVLMEDFEQAEKLPPEEQAQARSVLLAKRDEIVEKLLPAAIERKMLYLESLRQVGSHDEKKMEEIRKNMQKRVSSVFRTQLQDMAAKVRQADPEEYAALVRKNAQLFRVALVMKKANIESPDDPRLERILLANGTSLSTQQQAFMERALGQQAVGEKVNFHPEITHDEMLAYYRDHVDDFQIPRRAKWEQLTVLFNRFPDKYAAGEAIANMGNMVGWGGAPFWAVARKYSQERNAEKDGFHDWTEFGDLKVSRVINAAVFSLPLNELSDILIDEDGLHIVRVLEREDAHLVPFTDAQADIKEKLRIEMLNKAYGEYVARLRERTPIWTVYDDLPSPGRRISAAHPPAGLPH